MADEAQARAIVTGGRRWFADMASQLLEPYERDAVRGDHSELGVTGGRALREVLGLVIRRQAALWMDWRPWLALGTIVIPIGILLSHVSRHWAEGSAIYAWLYLGNGEWADLRGTVWFPESYEAAHFAAWFYLNAVTLIGWSWTAGWVLGSLARRTIWISGPLFYTALILGTLGSASIGRSPKLAHIFSMPFYGVLLPALLRTLLVVVPALWGMYQGSRSGTLSRRQTIFWAVALAILTARAAQSLEVSMVASWWPSVPYGDGWQLRLLLAVGISWPVTYMFANATWHRWRRTV